MPDDAVIEVRGLGKWYRTLQVLDGVDLVVRRGERVVVWGPSGSGKSTLIRCIAGLEPFQEGVVAAAGSTRAGSWRRRSHPVPRVGMVFQGFHLFSHLTVMENLTLGPREVLRMARPDAEARARALLVRMRVADKADAFPSNLSGGQQQRVAIARALCMEPEVMLFDEPTSALDPELKAEVAAVIAELAASGMTMVVVTHEQALAEALGGRIVLMAQGAIVGETDAAALFGHRSAGAA